MKILRSDDLDTEYRNNTFEKFLRDEGIEHQLSVEYTPEQNDAAERKNRTLVEMARCMISQSGLPPTFWAEAEEGPNIPEGDSEQNVEENMPEETEDEDEDEDEDPEEEPTYERVEEDGRNENASTINLDDPKDAREALASTDAEEWKQAMLTEYEALLKNSTWTGQ
ncbi:death domain-associated protein 6-like [Colletes gigas]|uniref:death domain-associated protein 6-like n=1 Tax=Colletes gigas TaxID=935657 RepID=UPI001C9AD6A5|nr:death domain-associated protein 6-like [Colletes gigas]